jgi:hypothetical protein
MLAGRCRKQTRARLNAEGRVATHLKGIWWISKGNEGERKVMKRREEKRSEAGFGFRQGYGLSAVVCNGTCLR